ncbi:ParA family protein [Ralstonia solanacearum]|uniref:AAA family ATPase n=1 Tax=Ralstonia solanacearum TaxID=305 RepID=A0AAE3T5L4_RALSL|nr:AAA family ATPase [Ralstonia solanacearum]MBB6581802.1 AAA family ATPase [Ralstonia solanacearum]MDB0523617.1 AAA family ATPase [Ralstonia solanacearum]
MAKIICLFNHKGGVSKTTTAFNLGWMMAKKGKRVLLADFDPQCNLTGMVMGFSGVEDLEAVYCASPANNVKDGLAPAFESQPRVIAPVACFDVKSNDNLMLLPGHIGLSEYETTLGVAQELTGSLLPLRNLPGSIRFLLDETAQANNIDYVLVDMSPSLGPLNQNLVSISDYFIVPLHPDYFSSMALSSLARTLPRWANWARTAHGLDVLQNADYPFPKPKSRFIGAIIQKYRPRNGRASQAFQTWIDRLQNGLQTGLVPVLEKAGMLDLADFKSRIGIEPWDPIMEVSDFNSIIALSQDFQVPVYELTKAQADQQGAIWKQTRKSMDSFEAAFNTCADRVFALTA